MNRSKNCMNEFNGLLRNDATRRVENGTSIFGALVNVPDYKLETIKQREAETSNDEISYKYTYFPAVARSSPTQF